MANRRKKSRASVNIPICLAGVLLCLTMFSFHLSGGVIARYTATTDGDDAARVIEFRQLTVDNTDVASSIVIPGVDISWEPTVSFGGSESSTYLFLEINLKNGSDTWHFDTDDKKTFTALYHNHDFDPTTPAGPGLTWSVSDAWTYLDGSADPYVYYRSLPPVTPQSDLPVVQGGTITVASTLLAADLANIVHAGGNLGFDFAASVVQSNGFTSANSVQDAWNSLETKHS